MQKHTITIKGGTTMIVISPLNYDALVAKLREDKPWWF